jgi:hypothetical protein
VTVTRTRLTGSTIAASVASSARRTNIVFTENVSEVLAAGGPYGGPILEFGNVDGLTVTGNVQSIVPRAELLDVWGSTDVTTDIES